MAFELAAYGAVIGLLYAKLNKRGVAGVYMALVPAMLAGRAVWGVAQTVLLGLGGNGFTMQMFIAGAFATALPGIVLQLVLIPVVMVGLEHAGVLRDTAVSYTHLVRWKAAWWTWTVICWSSHRWPSTWTAR